MYLGEGRKSDKDDGKYVNRKSATFNFQLKYKEAKTCSEIRVKKRKEKGSQGNLLSQQSAHTGSGYRERHIRQDFQTHK